jgi:hypothetical protein
VDRSRARAQAPGRYSRGMAKPKPKRLRSRAKSIGDGTVTFTPLSAPASVIDTLAAFFLREHRWPSRKEFLLAADREAIPFAPDAWYSNLSVGRDAQDPVRPSFRAVIAVEAVRDLLEPLPAVLRMAASAFVSQAPTSPDNIGPTLHFRDVKSLWADVREAQSAIHLVRSTNSGLLTGGGSSGSDPEDFWFSLSIDVLRFENVRDLEDVLRTGERAKVDVGLNPAGSHLELLRRIYTSSRSELRWPGALDFALANRDVGYVPDLVAELRTRFVRGEFEATNRHSIALTPHAFPFVGSPEDRRLFTDAVVGIVRLWRSRPEPARISVEELARELTVDVESLAPVAAFLEWAPWCQTGHVQDCSHANLVFTPGDPALVLRNKDIRSYDDYVRLWLAGDNDDASVRTPAALPQKASGDALATPHVPDVPLSFVSERYRKVLESDLSELEKTVAARAWKASLILIGGITECVLLDVLSRREDVTGSVLKKDLSRAALMDLIDAAVRLTLLPPTVKPLAEAAKDYRDLTHPFRAAVSPLRATHAAVKAMIHAFELVATELETARTDGRLSKFEST